MGPGEGEGEWGRYAEVENDFASPAVVTSVGRERTVR